VIHGSVEFSGRGAIRVSANPPLLPSPRRLEELGSNRFDDPEGQYVVRYLATALRGSFVELLARFRTNDEAETRLGSVVAVDDDYRTASLMEGLEDWLVRQRVGVCHLAAPALLVSVNDPELLARLNTNPRIRKALGSSELAKGGTRVELDEGVVRLAGVGRPITQAMSRVLYEMTPETGGIAYASRLDDSEWCWALYDRTPVRFEERMPSLDPGDPVHREALRSAAKTLGIKLPTAWL
jgi:hypothetical protein